MMFSVTLIFWKCRDTLFLGRVHPINQATLSWSSSATSSDDAFYFHPKAIELSVKDAIWYPCCSCWMFTYIYVYEDRNSSRFNVRMLCHYGDMCQRHPITLFLYPLMPYFQA